MSPDASTLDYGTDSLRPDDDEAVFMSIVPSRTK